MLDCVHGRCSNWIRSRCAGHDYQGEILSKSTLPCVSQGEQQGTPEQHASGAAAAVAAAEASAREAAAAARQVCLQLSCHTSWMLTLAFIQQPERHFCDKHGVNTSTGSAGAECLPFLTLLTVKVRPIPSRCRNSHRWPLLSLL